jgi:hypothetical protein
VPPCIIIKVNRGRKVAVVAEALCSQLSLRLLLLLGTTTTATTMSKLLFKINLANNMQNVHSLTKSKISVPKTKSLMSRHNFTLFTPTNQQNGRKAQDSNHRLACGHLKNYFTFYFCKSIHFDVSRFVFWRQTAIVLAIK